MRKKYDLIKINENEYTFNTDLGLSYCIELKKSNAKYIAENNEIKCIDIFCFSIFDRDYPIESDYRIRNTILSFLLEYFKQNRTDEIIFFINNEYENNKFSHRAKSRLKLFRRLFRIANSENNNKYIFFTNTHFILNLSEYKMDHIGIIIKLDSKNYNNILRAFNKFCHDNSYQKN